MILLCEHPAAFNVSPKTAAKWVRRYQTEGPAGLADRSSRPHRSPHRTRAELEHRIACLGRERWSGYRISAATGLSRATISRILRRLKLSRMRDLAPAPAVVRYEHAAPGDLLHLTRPYTPRTNGKAERFIQTALREWAYARAYQHSDQAGCRSASMASPLQLAPPPC